MAGRQPEEPPRGHFVCEYCNQVWPSAWALSGHIKAHIKGKASVEQAPAFPVPAPVSTFGPGTRMMPPVMPPSFFMPPPVMGMSQPVAPPAGILFGGVVPREQVGAPLRDPTVYDTGGAIRMVLLEPNHAFWMPYRMGFDPPVEIDFIGLGLRPRPESPSPSFASWLNNA